MEPKRKLLYIAAIFFLITCGIVFSACTYYGFDKEWIIGKTSLEVEEKYGEFDKRFDGQSSGSIQHGSGGYLIKEGYKDYALGAEYQVPPTYFLIRFDENGYAIETSIEEIGWGG